MERWAGKVAVVTGAASGIGSAICSELCKAGMIVCGLSTRKDKVEQLRLGLLGLEGSLCAVECDITNEASVKAAYTWIEKTQGGIDLLVNNAGSVRCVCVCVRCQIRGRLSILFIRLYLSTTFSKCMILEENNTRELRNMLENNLIGLCICIRDAVKMMKDHGFDGHIVNINRLVTQASVFA